MDIQPDFHLFCKVSDQALLLRQDRTQRNVHRQHISHWLDKYEGKYAASPCSCRRSRVTYDEGCADDPEGWCIAVGDMADYVVEMNIPDQQIEKLEEISEQMKQEELPKTREEFEGRALLYHILMDLEEFLVYKKRFVSGLDEKKLRIYWKQEMEQKDSANELQK